MSRWPSLNVGTIAKFESLQAMWLESQEVAGSAKWFCGKCKGVLPISLEQLEKAFCRFASKVHQMPLVAQLLHQRLEGNRRKPKETGKVIRKFERVDLFGPRADRAEADATTLQV